MVGCTSRSMKGRAAAIISPARMITEVVPSPTSSSWAREISSIDVAAGCVTSISRRIACPSLDSTMPPIGSSSIFSIERGPSVV